MTFLSFREVKDTGKTKIWKVENDNDGSDLGTIKWHGAWRKYVLFVEPNCLWSADCLEDVSNFIYREMYKRRKI